MRFDICGQFVLSVVTPEGGWSKGRPLAFVEERDRWAQVDLLIPNGLDDSALQSYVTDRFSAFATSGRGIRRLDILRVPSDTQASS
jgi:hypothetical protein